MHAGDYLALTCLHARHWLHTEGRTAAACKALARHWMLQYEHVQGTGLILEVVAWLHARHRLDTGGLQCGKAKQSLQSLPWKGRW